MAYVLKSRLVTDLIPAYAKPLTTPSFSLARRTHKRGSR